MSDCLGYLTLGGHASFCKKKKKKKTIKFTLISVGTLNLLWSKLFNGSGFPGGASGKEPTNQSRRPKKHGWIPGWGRSLGGGLGNPLQYSCLENPMDKGAGWATVLGVAKSQTPLKPLSRQAQSKGSVWWLPLASGKWMKYLADKGSRFQWPTISKREV